MTIFRYGFRNSTHDLQKSTVPSMQACDTDIAHALDLCWNPSKRRGHRELYLNNEIYSSNSFLLPRCVQRRLISKSFRRYLNTDYPLVRLCCKTEHRGSCFRSCIYIRTLWGQGWPLGFFGRIRANRVSNRADYRQRDKNIFRSTEKFEINKCVRVE